MPAYVAKSLSTREFVTEQCLQWQRSEPVFVGHLRVHTHLPVPLSERNYTAKRYTQCIAGSQERTKAQSLHKCFHFTTVSLQIPTGITKEQVV